MNNKSPSEKSISCSSGLTNRQRRNICNDKLKVFKDSSRPYSKPRTNLYRKENFPGDNCIRGGTNFGANFRPEIMTKEGRVHGGISLLESVLKAEKEGNFGGDGCVYDPNPLEARLGPVSVSGTEGRVHGGNLLALLAAGNGGLNGFRN